MYFFALFIRLVTSGYRIDRHWLAPFLVSCRVMSRDGGSEGGVSYIHRSSPDQTGSYILPVETWYSIVLAMRCDGARCGNLGAVVNSSAYDNYTDAAAAASQIKLDSEHQAPTSMYLRFRVRFFSSRPFTVTSFLTDTPAFVLYLGRLS